MAVISIRSFGGLSPRQSPRYLQDSQSQVAENCMVFTGPLAPLTTYGSDIGADPLGNTHTTIYKWGQDSEDDTFGWLSWEGDVDVCRSQIAGDTEEWTFYTGDGAPRAIRLGALYTPLKLGQGAPTTPATITLGTPPEDVEGLTQETRVYTYTFVNKVGGREIESAPAPASISLDVYPDQTVSVTDFDTVPSGHAATHIRIYRATAGVFLFTQEITLATTTYVDAVDPEDLLEPIPSLTWLEPSDDLKGLINLPNGIMAGFVGRDVYFCEPYVPHAWPAEYSQTMDYPIVGFGAIDTTLVVLTKGTPYIIQGSDPASMVVVRSDLEQACVSKRSIVSFGGAVFYASPDGLVAVSPGGSTVLTEQLFDKEQWQAYFSPESIHAYQYETMYIGFYENSNGPGSFIYDTKSKQFALTDLTVDAGYLDLRQDKLFVKVGTSIRSWTEGAPLTYHWRSKKFSLPQVTGMSCSQVEAESYPVTAKYYVEGSLVHTQTVTSREPFRLPAVKGRDWEVELSGSAEVFSAIIAQGMEEIAGA